MKVILANRGYEKHITSEGDQLQRGLHLAGWTLCGYGYDGLTHVPDILTRYRPDIVLVQDVRDWHSDSPGCYDKRYHFTGIDALRTTKVPKFAVWKDMGTAQEFQREMFHRMGVLALVTYYSRQAALAIAPWGPAEFPLIRTWHSIDNHELPIKTLALRDRGVVSGARNPAIYPLREQAFRHLGVLGIDGIDHPGYGATGCQTGEYLRRLAQYKTHLATASAYNFALRKIIESVAVGAVPITTLPAEDILPNIDRYLLRVAHDIDMVSLANRITEAEGWWSLSLAEEMKTDAKWYLYTTMGLRLNQEIEMLAREVTA